jgi:hypothetical protein
MEIVTGEPAPTVERDEAARLLHEMAAVVRTVLGVRAESAAPTQVAARVPVVAGPPVPTALPVPTLAVPDLAPPAPVDPAEPRSLALLQEIAFLDE